MMENFCDGLFTGMSEHILQDAIRVLRVGHVETGFEMFSRTRQDDVLVRFVILNRAPNLCFPESCGDILGH